ncbi:HAMP domain-containing histidine kinase [Clostridium tagluense]|uniref:sensor histidine kinase n=1 Tax=Clostridium tagluense TaxID=360422 RepID=UPI001C0C75CD|nr:HAMP domain-containing sensor histidine kinase [Clostridium tagluense]MBU3127845.1 HAMP domain-containing histidine kinase [Clostridium tagluense]MCB2310128.1 HAMP domain-containing histidine kinase [Clostridium tagluense]MCB2315230.1 HAMP domain-containing histidine kinase [Clostridium tagluense]MCB2319828.1 HAMP domain-containing histidine kinase [Clostridium tagluense]MCB2324973.1 HAMP domain-containing histidine kinase [Clostridium tagluense]
MKTSKNTIRKQIFFSHITVITMSLLLTFVSFNLYLNFYVEKQTSKQLIEVAKYIEKSMLEASMDWNDIQKFKTASNTDKNLSIINKDLKNTESFLATNYAIIGANMDLIYPEKRNNEEYTFVQNNIMSIISKKKGLLLEDSKKPVFYFNASERKYVAIVHHLKLSNKTKNVNLVVYSDLFKSKGFIKIVNDILLLILIIMIISSVITSKNVSKKISRIILLLSNYAKKIGERQYSTEFIEYNKNYEIAKFAETMQSMTKKLYTYDRTMKGFMQNASHELRTPLMSIQGYAEGIKYGVVDEQDKAIDIIIEESKRLSNLVEELLYLSKIEVMQCELNLEEINVEYIIKSSIERINGIAIKNKKTIEFTSNDNNIIIIGDEEKLTRAIINILGNCLRYCSENIDVILKNEGSKAIIIIEDDGPGFEEKDLDNIFERFFKGNGGNYGLGLAITKSIIEKHDGNVVAENSTKGGACFIITLNEVDTERITDI